ncbi:type II toxin-antitoxin system HicB family antitoxin [Candidatus Bathyarchaeota archaeon]|nr:type II toxin-antitoxin system HicB family antitoxin [Candidatus Bathyarchaeota archaeon]
MTTPLIGSSGFRTSYRSVPPSKRFKTTLSRGQYLGSVIEKPLVLEPYFVDGPQRSLPIGSIRNIEVNHQDFTVLSQPLEDGCFMARTSSPKFNAIGQGDSEEEAIEDLRDAILALQEVTG